MAPLRSPSDDLLHTVALSFCLRGLFYPPTPKLPFGFTTHFTSSVSVLGVWSHLDFIKRHIQAANCYNNKQVLKRPSETQMDLPTTAAFFFFPSMYC